MKETPEANAFRILNLLDEKLTSRVRLTLYGRAALQLGFDNPVSDFALSCDVDGILWVGQAEDLFENTNFWQAVESVNDELAPEGLYISHFFEETQVILSSAWRGNCRRINGLWERLELFRLGDADLLLSKLMRDDPQDQSDAKFIIKSAGMNSEVVQSILAKARLPDDPEIREQFQKASGRLLTDL